MTAILQRDPAQIRSLILDSPLPMFVPIDEDEPANFAEALHIFLERVEQDPTGNPRYTNLRQRFERYFTDLDGKTFSSPYGAYRYHLQLGSQTATLYSR
ncbi:hypothetical protein IC229_22580 [Spirosoma sp. BT702]|uniref:Uncharacterized protein n=1 Tax=Spirosoma profusum TaxID=2771354 RepID=A0A926XYW2_9BACT|nr:hypothetical protein [Spirosoma profusum]MBD2703448.1 hypothetical protein [Spirosoma profusum]